LFEVLVNIFKVKHFLQQLKFTKKKNVIYAIIKILQFVTNS